MPTCLHFESAARILHCSSSSLVATDELLKWLRVRGMPQGMPLCHESPEPLVRDAEATSLVTASQGMGCEELLQLAGRQQHGIQLCVPHHGLHEQAPSVSSSLPADAYDVLRSVRGTLVSTRSSDLVYKGTRNAGSWYGQLFSCGLSCRAPHSLSAVCFAAASSPACEIIYITRFQWTDMQATMDEERKSECIPQHLCHAHV